MRSGLAKFSLYLAGAVVLGGCLALLFLQVLNWPAARPAVESVASRILMREVAIDGSLHLDLFPTPTLSIQGLHIANADWGVSGDLLIVDTAVVALDLASLLGGKIHITAVEIDGLTVNLEVSGKLKNWQFSGPGIQPADDQPMQLPSPRDIDRVLAMFPPVDRLDINDVNVSYMVVGQPVLSANVTDVGGSWESGLATARVVATGLVNDAPMQLRLSAGRENGGGTVGFDLKVQSSGLALHLSGVPATFLAEASTLEFSAVCEASSPLLRRLRLGHFDLPAFELTTTIGRRHHGWELNHLIASLGQSRLVGSVAYFSQQKSKRPLVKVDLVFERLRLSDVEALLPVKNGELPSGTLSAAKPAPSLSAVPDLDLRLRAARVSARRYAQDLTASAWLDATFRDGLLSLRQARVAVEKFGKTVFKAHASGVIHGPWSPKNSSIYVMAESANPKPLLNAAGYSVGETPPVRLKFHLLKSAADLALLDLDASAGQTQVKGSIKYRPGVYPRIDVDLASPVVRYNDIEAFLPQTAQAQQSVARAGKTAKGWTLSTSPLPLDYLTHVNGSLKFRVAKLVGLKPSMTFDSASVDADLDGGYLRISEIRLASSRGRVAAGGHLDIRQTIPIASFSGVAAGVKVGRLIKPYTREVPVPDFRGTTLVEASVGGTVEVASSGRSSSELVRNSSGEATLYTEHGEVSALAVEIFGFDLTQTVTRWFQKLPETDIRCMYAHFDLDGGQVTSEAGLLSMDDSNVRFSGAIDLVKGTIDARAESLPNDWSIGSFRAPLDFMGPLTEIKARPDYSILGLRVAAAVALGLVVSPVAVILPFTELSPGQGKACEKFERRIDLAREAVANGLDAPASALAH